MKKKNILKFIFLLIILLGILSIIISTVYWAFKFHVATGILALSAAVIFISLVILKTIEDQEKKSKL